MPRWQVHTIAGLIFLGIMCAPFVAWVSLSEGGTHLQRESVGWAFGLSMILWLPLTIMIAVWVSRLVARSLSPKQKTTLGDLARRSSEPPDRP